MSISNKLLLHSEHSQCDVITQAIKTMEQHDEQVTWKQALQSQWLSIFVIMIMICSGFGITKGTWSLMTIWEQEEVKPVHSSVKVNRICPCQDLCPHWSLAHWYYILTIACARAASPPNPTGQLRLFINNEAPCMKCRDTPTDSESDRDSSLSHHFRSSSDQLPPVA